MERSSAGASMIIISCPAFSVDPAAYASQIGKYSVPDACGTAGLLEDLEKRPLNGGLTNATFI